MIVRVPSRESTPFLDRLIAIVKSLGTFETLSVVKQVDITAHLSYQNYLNLLASFYLR